MSQQLTNIQAALRKASRLLAFGLLAVCLPVVALAQEPEGRYTARRPSAYQPTVGSSQAAAEVKPLPDTDAKISALIGEIMPPEAKLELHMRASQVIRMKQPITRVSITDPKVLEVVQFSPTEFELIGLQTGDTSLTFWFGGDKALRYFVHVAPDKGKEIAAKVAYRELQDKINEMFPNSTVQLIPLADKLIVRGQARDSAEASQILAMLSGRGANLAEGGAAGRGGIINLGRAALPNPESDIPIHNIINLLDVPGEQQVMLKVRIAQLDRTAARNMKTQLRINSGILALNTESGGLSAAFTSVMNAEDLRLAITAVNTSSYTKILAEPNLVTLNGQPASFMAGGEFPVPTAVGIGGVSGINTQFQRFGTQLTFTPTIVDKDRIRLAVKPSFSAVNRDLTVNGIPGISNRAVETTVDLRVGQWLAIAGLLEDDQRGTKIRIPFVGDIPVIGAAFGQTSLARTETELMILVSPELVHPMDAREAPLVLPGMEIGEPGDVAFFLGGAYVGQYDRPRKCGAGCATTGTATADDEACATGEARQQAVRATMSRPEYQRSEKYYVYGQHGTSN
jgi:pilus assembly protein CpaC